MEEAEMRMAENFLELSNKFEKLLYILTGIGKRTKLTNRNFMNSKVKISLKKKPKNISTKPGWITRYGYSFKKKERKLYYLKKTPKQKIGIFKITQKPNVILTFGFIYTSFGKIRIRYIGDPKKHKKLILIVHGSGPTNSGNQYAQTIRELSIRYGKNLQYLICSIDCPGYGESDGLHQSIRSSPTAVLRECITSLGFKRAECLFGHSQGGCSVWNAVLTDPSICRLVIQDRIVWSITKIRELSKMKQPNLLIYDSSDKGHPVNKKYANFIQKCTYVEYSGKKLPLYWDDNFTDIMIDFLKKNESVKKKTKK